MLVTLCLTESTNGTIKLYSVRPRPLWLSIKLQRKGSVWEKVGTRLPSIKVANSRRVIFAIQDSSFPSSHAQSVATLFSFLFLEGKEHLPYTVWFYASLATGFLTLLTGFSRAYLAMHFVSDVVAGWCLGFLVALMVTKLDIVETFARIPVPWAVFLSLFSATYITGCLLLAAHIGKMNTDQKTLDKWLQTALRNSKKAASSGERKEGELAEGKVVERIAPHDVVSYMVPAAAYLCSTLFPALLSLRHPHHPRSAKHSPLTFYRPYTATTTKPSLSFWIVGVLGLAMLDILKSVVVSRKKRELWPVWRQAGFYLVYHAISIAWVLAGSGLVHARQGWVKMYM